MMIYVCVHCTELLDWWTESPSCFGMRAVKRVCLLLFCLSIAAVTAFVYYFVQDNDYAKNYYESDESRGDDEDDNLDADGY